MQNNTFSGLIVGQKIVVLDRIDSTNNYLKTELAKSTPFPEGTVIMAEEQYSGRGQAGNRWLSSPGLNLTISILLTPVAVPPENQFDLNIAVSLAINDVLQGIVGKGLRIKWPNDVYFNDSKIGGVLIENSLLGKRWKNSVVGIGLNVNQTAFDPSLRNVSSLQLITGQPLDKKVLLSHLCQALDQRYRCMNLQKELQHSEYVKNLYGLGEWRNFIVNNGEIMAKIEGVDASGRLVLNVNNELKAFSFKELSFVL